MNTSDISAFVPVTQTLGVYAHAILHSSSSCLLLLLKFQYVLTVLSKQMFLNGSHNVLQHVETYTQKQRGRERGGGWRDQGRENRNIYFICFRSGLICLRQFTWESTRHTTLTVPMLLLFMPIYCIRFYLISPSHPNS